MVSRPIQVMGEKTEPLVSVVIPTYGRPDLLQDAVKSVLNQTYNNIELLVVDDCSPTPAKKSLASISTTHSRTIRIIRHDANKGANVARNTGIKNASGNFIAFLDDDDRWDPTKIKRQVVAFQKADDSVGVVYTGEQFINEDGNTTSVHISKVRGDVTKKLLCGARIAPFSNVMVRSDVIQQAGLPDERFPCWQDRDWYVRLSQYCEFQPVPELLVIRYAGDHDRISDDYERKKNEAYPLFLEKYRSVAADYGQIYKRKMEASLLRQLGEHALRQRKYHEARKQLMKSIVHYPFIWETYLYLLVSISGERGYRIARKCKRLHETRGIENTTA